MTNKALYNLAKATLSTLYFNCVTGLNEIAKECWKIYHTKREDDLTVTNWHRIAALRMAIDINDEKFSMFTHARPQ